MSHSALAYRRTHGLQVQEETASREPDAPQPDTAFLLQIGGVPPAASHGSRRGTGG